MRVTLADHLKTPGRLRMRANLCAFPIRSKLHEEFVFRYGSEMISLSHYYSGLDQDRFFLSDYMLTVREEAEG